MHVRTTYHSEVRTATALAGHRVTLGILSTELLTLVAIVAVWTNYKNEDKMILTILKIKESFLENVLVKTMAARNMYRTLSRKHDMSNPKFLYLSLILLK